MRTLQNEIPADPQALADLERGLQAYLAQPPWSLCFPPDIELEFERRARNARMKRFHQGILAALIVNAGLGLGELLLVTGTGMLSAAIRLGVIGLSVAVMRVLLPRVADSFHREWLLALLFGVMLVAQLSCVAIIQPPLTTPYEGALLLMLLLCNQLTRIRYRFALPFTVFWWLAYLVQEVIMEASGFSELGLSAIFSGALAWMSISAKRDMELDNRATHVLKRLNTISAFKLEQANAKLNAEARFDPLTGLANRREFDAYFERIHANAIRSGEPLTLIFIDVDFFKRFNDRYGHAAGDDCLCFVASLIRFAARRPLDMAARYGGEEFVVLLPDTPPEDALHVAEELRGLIENTHMPHLDSPLGCVTVSMGVAGGPPARGASPTSLIEVADAALYAAKEAGRNRAVLSVDGLQKASTSSPV